MDIKDKTLAAISHAKADLEDALDHLEHLPAFDPGTVGFAAHALNNYLTVIDGTTQLIQAALQGRADPEVVSWLEGLQHTTQLMTHTVHQLMNGSAGDAALLKLGKVDLPLLVERACAYYRRIAARKQITVEFSSRAETAIVWADRVAVAAALDNLLSNAVKYSPRSKTVRVEVKSELGSLECSVRDEGPGLNEADQANLFLKGVRLSSVPTGGEPSTGYGLAVAKDLVTRMGGEIWCESKPGAGACFSIRLPAVVEGIPKR